MSKIQLKTPKGTKDWAGKDMVIRQTMFDSITKIFKRHGGETIDTPVFEVREFLTGKYGEDSKLIYNLEEHSGETGEKLSLRYDLTVPFARYVALNGIEKMKRYHVAKVYRRDQPAMGKGRFREFYQCDFDIAGAHVAMAPDAECLSIVTEVMRELKITGYTIKLNHRKVLDGIFGYCGVPEDKVRAISSAVDKLDKLPWADVRKEMTVDKGLDEDVADKIGKYVQLKGSLPEMITTLKNDEELMSNASAKEGIDDMETLLPFAEAYNIINEVSFDLSLARGLDYYTGLIYEVVTADSAPPAKAVEGEVPVAPTADTASKKSDKKSKKNKKNADDDNSENVGVGSIAAGGRYDKLVGMFSNKNVPCVGISFGVERLFTLIKKAGTFDHLNATSTQVYVLAFGGGPEWDGFLSQRMKVAKMLWDNGIDAEFMYKKKVNAPKQFEAAERSGAKFGLILGQQEYADGKVKIKRFGTGETFEGVDVPLDGAVAYIKEELAKLE